MKSNKVITVLTLVLFLGVFYGMQQSKATEGIDVRQAQSMSKQGALLLDVREPGEYAEVHIPNAKPIPLGQLNTRIPEINMYKDKPIVVICHSGRRSAKAVQLLQEAGFSKVSNVSGGMMAWESAGMEVIKSK